MTPTTLEVGQFFLEKLPIKLPNHLGKPLLDIKKPMSTEMLEQNY